MRKIPGCRARAAGAAPAALALLLAACASPPPFRKLDEGLGYVAHDTPISGIVAMEVRLPPDTKSEVRAEYLLRAAGEECAARKHPYFDVGADRNIGARAFCSDEPAAANLGITLDPRAALRVGDTRLASRTPMHAWDVIRKVGGREVHDAAELKDAVYFAGRRGETHTTVVVERSDIPLTLECPIVVNGDDLGTPDTLRALRAKLP